MVRVSHPKPVELADFVRGKLSAADAAAVEEHLRGCDGCVRSLEEQPEDDALLRLARQAGTFADAAPAQPGPPTDPTSEAATVALPPPGASRETDVGRIALGAAPGGEVPALLAGHPRYRVLRLLGEGGMGSVYVAEHRVMRRLVALKVIKHEYTADPIAVERFRREVRAAAQLQHPNIVAAHDADRAGATHFLVMEYVAGVSLGRLLQERGPLPVAQACAAVRQAALALQHAHERGLVHRDVKPENLMLAADGTVKVLDFGLAALSAERGAEGLTSANALMGTLDFMAPEQAEDPRQADTRADVYSLGCTLYQLLTGQVPYPAATPVLKILAHRERPLPAVRALRPEVSPGLAAVLSRMLAKRPAGRYRTPGEAAAALAPFATAGPEAAAGRSRRWLLLAAGLLGLLGVAVYLFGQTLLQDSGEDRRAVKGDAPQVQPRVPESAARGVSWSSPGPKNFFADPAHPLSDVLDFRDLAGASLKELRDWADALGPKFRVSSVTNRRGRGPALFNAVAVRERKPLPFAFCPEVTPDEATAHWTSQGEKGFRPVGICAYLRADQKNSWADALLWVKDGTFPYSTSGPREAIVAGIAEWKGCRPTYLDGLALPDRPLYRCIVPGDLGRTGKPFYTLSPDQLLATVESWQRKGWRPDVLAPHWEGGQLRFMLVVDNSDRVDWRFRMDMRLEEYQDESARQKRHGLFPLALASYGNEADVHYAAIWVRYRLPAGAD